MAELAEAKKFSAALQRQVQELQAPKPPQLAETQAAGADAQQGAAADAAEGADQTAADSAALLEQVKIHEELYNRVKASGIASEELVAGHASSLAAARKAYKDSLPAGKKSKSLKGHIGRHKKKLSAMQTDLRKKREEVAAATVAAEALQAGVQEMETKIAAMEVEHAALEAERKADSQGPKTFQLNLLDFEHYLPPGAPPEQASKLQEALASVNTLLSELASACAPPVVVPPVPGARKRALSGDSAFTGEMFDFDGDARPGDADQNTREGDDALPLSALAPGADGETVGPIRPQAATTAFQPYPRESQADQSGK